MLRSMFSGVSGLRTHQNKMDVIGNNIANVNTVGFKSGRVTFKDSIYQNIYSSSDGNDIYGGSNPSQVGYGSQVSAVSINFGTGSYEPTGFGTDCMINGSGFFLVGPKLEDGNTGMNVDAVSGLNLTRVGEFTIDGDGYLVDANKNVVYGFWGQNGEVGEGTADWKVEPGIVRPIRLPNNQTPPVVDDEDTERLNLTGISIDANGVISGQTSDGTTYKFGVVAVANVTNPNALENSGNSYYKAVSNTGTVQAFQPGEGATGILQTGCLEMSNVDLATEFSNMITTQRGFQACSKMITVSDEMLQELVNLKR